MSQGLSILVALLAAAVAGEAIPSAGDAALAIAAGACGTLGITALYVGLSTGQMGIVAPISAVVGAAVPVAVGALLEGPPEAVRALGFGLALVAVVLVSRSSAPGAGRQGLPYALAAGLGFGLFFVIVSRVTPGHVFGQLAVARVAGVVLLALIVAVTRRAWRLPGRALPLVLAAGVLDIAGNVSFIVAAQSGRLDVAAILSSLYPVTTILLAVVVLHERLVRGHRIGIALALAAIVLIAGG